MLKLHGHTHVSLIVDYAALPARPSALELPFALAQPGKEGIGEAALFVAVGLQAIHCYGILGKVRHLTEQASRDPPVLASITLNCLLWCQAPSATTNTFWLPLSTCFG